MGASLGGGRSYTMPERGFRQTLKMITGIGTNHFTPLHLTYGIMQGMAQELHDMYPAY